MKPWQAWVNIGMWLVMVTLLVGLVTRDVLNGWRPPVPPCACNCGDAP